jgi:hypothetical protein
VRLDRKGQMRVKGDVDLHPSGRIGARERKRLVSIGDGVDRVRPASFIQIRDVSRSGGRAVWMAGGGPASGSSRGFSSGLAAVKCSVLRRCPRESEPIPETS